MTMILLSRAARRVHIVRVFGTVLAVAAISACSTQDDDASPSGGGASGGGSSGSGGGDGGDPQSGLNVLPVTVNGSLCIDAKYTNVNEPCTSVTVCQPGTQTCQTISGILVDTGSTGLRLFASVVELPLQPVPSGSGTLAGCHAFSGGKSSWGSLAMADVVLGGEPAVTTPVFLIDSQFSSPAGPCDPSQSDLDTTPEDSGFNGILGISHYPDDCGDFCRTNPDNETYYSCGEVECTPTATDVQLQNPVALLPVDNNGVILKLPAVPAAGAPSVTGSLILGIGTRPNNMPGDVVVFPTADFETVFPDFSATPIRSGTIDSGSSKLYFPSIAGLPACDAGSGGPESQTGILCPKAPRTLTATMVSGTTEKTITFTVDNAYALLDSANSVFPGYASAVGVDDPYFMWGLPFFLGRSVYVAIDDRPTSLGTGPYWAY